MNLFLYMPSHPEMRERVMSAVAPLVNRGSIELFEGVPELVDRLRKIKEFLSVAIIWAPSRDDLRILYSNRPFLDQTKLLLVLPDQEDETLTLAHRVLPTFVTYVDSPLSDLVAVMKRLTEPRAMNMIH